MLRAQKAVELQRVVHHGDAPAMPVQFQRRVGKLEAVGGNGPIQALALQVIVAENAVQGRFEVGEDVQGLGLGDVAGVNDALDAGSVEQFNDPGNVLQVVVGVADDANAHGTSGACASRLQDAQTFSD